MPINIDVRRTVGKTSFELPIFGFGSAHLGELYGTVDEAVARDTLEAAWDAGVRYYDTAPWYGRGLSEHRVGGFLRTMPRGDFQISTKVGRTLHRPADPKSFDRSPWVGGLNFEVKFDYSHDGIMRSYEQALQRLALDKVDALVIHDLDAAYHDLDTYIAHRRDLSNTGIKALEELKSSGDIGAFGMGINTNEAFETVAPEVDLDFLLVAMPYTLLDQDSLHRGMADCLKRGVSVIIGAPYASGILATGAGEKASYGYAAAPPEVQEKARRLAEGRFGACDPASGCRASVPAGASGGRFDHPRRGTATGSDAKRRLYGNADSARVLGGSQGPGALAADAPVPGDAG